MTQDNAPKRGSFQPKVITNDCQVVITPSPWFYKSPFTAAVLPATALLETLETPKMDQFPKSFSLTEELARDCFPLNDILTFLPFFGTAA